MILRKHAETDSGKRRLGVVGIVLCVIFGAALAFLAAVFDGVMSFGGSNTRFAVVFLICSPVGALISYVAIRDMQEKWFALRNPNPEPRSLTEPRVIFFIVAIVILGLLSLISAASR